MPWVKSAAISLSVINILYIINNKPCCFYKGSLAWVKLLMSSRGDPGKPPGGEPDKDIPLGTSHPKETSAPAIQHSTMS